MLLVRTHRRRVLHSAQRKREGIVIVVHHRQLSQGVSGHNNQVYLLRLSFVSDANQRTRIVKVDIAHQHSSPVSQRTYCVRKKCTNVSCLSPEEGWQSSWPPSTWKALPDYFACVVVSHKQNSPPRKHPHSLPNRTRNSYACPVSPTVAQATASAILLCRDHSGSPSSLLFDHILQKSCSAPMPSSLNYPCQGPAALQACGPRPPPSKNVRS